MARTITYPRREVLAPEVSVFDARREDVDIFLTGELGNGVHDLVGHPAQHRRLTNPVGVVGEVQRLAEDEPRARAQGNAAHRSARL